MHIRIREIHANRENNGKDLYLEVYKSTTIKNLQKKIELKTKIPINHQKLYYKGKELNPEYIVADYDICLNDVIQMLVKKTETQTEEVKKVLETISVESKYYSIGDRIDAFQDGFWIEAKIIDILSESPQTDEEKLSFKVEIDRGVQSPFLYKNFHEVRPRSFYTYKSSELRENMTVLANYCIDSPVQVGYWYDFYIKKVTPRTVQGKLIHEDRSCTLKRSKTFLRIEKPNKSTQIPRNLPLREMCIYCEECNDDLAKTCKKCGCTVCNKKEDVGVLIICDECNLHFHLTCLDPPLSEIPADLEWFCSTCKINPDEIVQAGAPLKTKKFENHEGKEWGKGMACVSRKTECTLVPKTHFGPIPGVEVGTCWKYRIQVSEAGVHRPSVAGIHGGERIGAYSLILSGGYEDDVDNGNEFFYTGSGGRDLSGGRRENCQSFDQKLSRMNKALALNCNTRFNETEGGEAEDWRKGRPVRVVRNYKLGKHSKFAPKEGNRYDGIYKVVKYFPERGISGFLVWKYLLRRDDPAPAPWEEGAKKFDIIYPEGYCETFVGVKRKKDNVIIKDSKLTKKIKIEPYVIPKEIQVSINRDERNEILWKNCLEFLGEGKKKFLEVVEETFMCVCCRELVSEPISTVCKHNICKGCLKLSFEAENYTCPSCRFNLTESYSESVNTCLMDALKMLFPRDSVF